MLPSCRHVPADRHSGSESALQGLHPAIVFTLVMLAGLAATAALSICLGLLVTRVIEPAWGIGAADERVIVWVAAQGIRR